jgi:hypothetical protein
MELKTASVVLARLTRFGGVVRRWFAPGFLQHPKTTDREGFWVSALPWILHVAPFSFFL